MLVRFNTTKTIQATAVLLKQHDGRISRLRLLKLLYMADRECLRRTLRSITGDSAVAMDNGPVLSQTYDLIKGSHHDCSQWDTFIQRDGLRDVKLINDPGNGQLSKREMNILVELSREHIQDDDYAIADATHEYPEYKKHSPAKGNCTQIPLEDILKAIGLADQLQHIIEENKADADMDRLLHAAKVEAAKREAAKREASHSQ